MVTNVSVESLSFVDGGRRKRTVCFFAKIALTRDYGCFGEMAESSPLVAPEPSASNSRKDNIR